MQTLSRPVFLEKFLPTWQQGQHLTITAPTGSGKTYLVADLLARWRYSIVLATKKQDDTLKRYHGFARREKWYRDWHEEKIILNPKPANIDDNATQRAVAHEAMSIVFEQGGWTFVIDDTYYVCDELKLTSQLRMLYTNVRSNASTIIANLQMPTWVPKQCFSQATYVFLFKIYGTIEIYRVADATSISRQALLAAVNDLDPDKHEFLCIRQGSPELLKVT